MIQAFTHDHLVLLNAYEQCQIDINAYIAARELLIKKQEEILRELEADTP